MPWGLLLEFYGTLLDHRVFWVNFKMAVWELCSRLLPDHVKHLHPLCTVFYCVVSQISKHFLFMAMEIKSNPRVSLPPPSYSPLNTNRCIIYNIGLKSLKWLTTQSLQRGRGWGGLQPPTVLKIMLSYWEKVFQPPTLWVTSHPSPFPHFQSSSAAPDTGNTDPHLNTKTWVLMYNNLHILTAGVLQVIIA